jgi:hypothetical protein
MMNKGDFEKSLLTLLRQEPFQPFLIELDDGAQFVVGERAALHYLGGETAVYAHVDGNLDFVNTEVVRRIVALVSAPAKG